MFLYAYLVLYNLKAQVTKAGFEANLNPQTFHKVLTKRMEHIQNSVVVRSIADIQSLLVTNELLTSCFKPQQSRERFRENNSRLDSQCEADSQIARDPKRHFNGPRISQR